MKIVHLSVGDPFTAAWVNSQADDGHEVHLIMLEREQERILGVKTYVLPFPKPYGYFLNVFHLKSLLDKIKPDFIHVHYATGNGTLGRLCRYRPAILSIWGSDVMIAPFESKMMRRLVLKNLRHYDWICSTSKIMADHTLRLCPNIKNLSRIPIGVDIDRFYPKPESKRSDIITVGTVKALDPIYGIDILIQSFAKTVHYLNRTNPSIAKRLQLMIVGGGPQEGELKTISRELGINQRVYFIGQVPHHRVPEYLNHFDIFVAMSRLESFGVAQIEASACELPIVASRVGGVPEVVQDHITGFLVSSEDIEGCSNVLTNLILNPNLRNKMGKAGRNFVLKEYRSEYCMSQMYSLYDAVLKKSNNNLKIKE